MSLFLLYVCNFRFMIWPTMKYAYHKGKRISAFQAVRLDNYHNEAFTISEKSDCELFPVKGSRNKYGTYKKPYFKFYTIKHYQKRYGKSASTVIEEIKYYGSKTKSEWHNTCQEIAERRPGVEIEVRFEKPQLHIADIVYKNVIIEVQHSPISPDEFLKRTNYYKKLGYIVVWLFDLTQREVIDDDPYSLKIYLGRYGWFFELAKNSCFKDRLVYINDQSGRVFRVKRFFRVENTSKCHLFTFPGDNYSLRPLNDINHFINYLIRCFGKKDIDQ